MQPGVSGGQAILTAGDGLGKLCDVNVIEMGADGHLVVAYPPLHQLVTSAAYSSAPSSQVKCPASMMSSLLWGSRSWRNSALDLARFERYRAGADVLGRIRRDVESGIASGEVRGTPTLFIEGVVHLGGYDATTLMKALA
jgi:hypothetical protein